MLKNGYIGLLKEKVKNCSTLVDFIDLKYYPEIVREKGLGYNLSSYLLFIKGGLQIEPRNYSIFEYIHDDFKFYKSLFKNYPQYFIKPFIFEDIYKIESSHALSLSNYNTHIIGYRPTDLLDYTANVALEFDNICAFSILVKSFGYIGNVDMFCRAVDFGSTKIAKFLIKSLNLVKNDILAKVWKSSTFTKSTPLNKEVEPTPKPFKLINKSVDFLINDLKFIPPKELNKINEDIYHVDIKSLSVGDLFEICNTIALLLEETNLFEDFLKSIDKKEVRDKYMGYTDKLQNYLPNPSIDFLSRIKLAEMKSNTTVNEYYLSSLVGSVSKKDETVFKLFKMALIFTNHTTNYKENYLFFNCKYFNDLSQNIIHSSWSEESLNCELPFEFGSYDDLISMDYNLDLGLDITLFKYINTNEQEDIEKQFEFIEKSILEINNINGGCAGSTSIRKIKLAPKFLMKLLLSIDRLDLIIYFIEQVKESQTKLNELIPDNLIELIQSTTTFDYFINLESIFIYKIATLENCLINNHGINLMQHIKLNYKIFYNELISNSTMNHIENNDKKINYSIESLLFIYRNINDFIHCYKSIEIWTRWDYLNLSLDQFIELVNNTPPNEKYSYFCGSIDNQYIFIDCSLSNFHGVVGYSYISSYLHWTENDFKTTHKSTYSRLQWIKLNRPWDLVSKRCDNNYCIPIDNSLISKRVIKTFKSLYQYHIGTFDVDLTISKFWNGISKIKDSENKYNIPANPDILKRDFLFYHKMSYIIGSRGDIDALDKIFKNVFSGKDFNTISSEKDFINFFITPLIVIATYHGRIDIFKYLKTNQSWTLNPTIDKCGNYRARSYEGKRILSQLTQSLIKTAAFLNNLDILSYFKNDLLIEHFKELEILDKYLNK